MIRTIATTLAATLAFAGLPLAAAAQPVEDGTPNVPENVPAFAEQTEAPAQVTPDVARSVVARGLSQPWAVAVLPGDAGYLVTEREGHLRHIARDGTVSEPLAGVPEVFAMRQGGLLDVALAPDFADSRTIYLTYSAPLGLMRSATAAARATLARDLSEIGEVERIFLQDPPSRVPVHFGSRVVPMPDGTIVVTTGDRGIPENAALAQDPATTYGAVVRITPDGAPAPGNPFADTPGARPELFSHGHRNIQGAALHPDTGALWTIEHGPAGGDELNLIEPGGNYGWPVVSYGVNYNGSDIGEGRAAHAPDFVPPRYYWDPVIAPGGMVVYDGAMFPEWQGDLLIAGLVAQAVVRLDLDGDTVRGEERLADGTARIRDVAIDHDGSVLFVTGTDDAVLGRLSRP